MILLVFAVNYLWELLVYSMRLGCRPSRFSIGQHSILNQVFVGVQLFVVRRGWVVLFDRLNFGGGVGIIAVVLQGIAIYITLLRE